MTLYLKYRPQTIEELDLEIVRNRLRELVAAKELPHAFLFAGPRGTGKTSAARILAKIVNCEAPVKTENGLEPCNSCTTCKAIAAGRSMDVVELDTASNRGIEDIRNLRESINLAPSGAKKKIYIMDEAHMLTLEAANAFLKTLEEPPSHVIFILATTDPAKLPETVRSRLVLVQFQKATAPEISRSLTRIIKSEALKVDDEVIEIISSRADGSLRDAVKMLEGLMAGGKTITKEKAHRLLLSTNLINLPDFTNLIFEKKTRQVLDALHNFTNSGGSVRELIDMLQKELRAKLLAGERTSEVLSLLKFLMEARGNLGKTYSEELVLEIALIEWCGEAVSPAKKKEPLNNSVFSSEVWSRILSETRNKNVSLETLLRSARPINIDGNVVNVAVYYQFHKERLEAETYRKMFEGVIAEVLGIDNPRVICKLEDPPANKFEPEKTGLTPVPEADIIKAAEEIFGE